MMNKNLKFYIFNDDIPTERFQLINKHLEPLSSEIVNLRISNQGLNNFPLISNTQEFNKSR